MPPEAQRGIRARLAFLGETAPLIISRAGLATMGIVDMVMLARLMPGDLAVAGLAEGTFGRLIDVCVAFLIGALPLLGFANALGDRGAALAIWRRSCVAALLLALPCLALGAGAGALLGWLEQPLAGPAARVVGIHAAGAAFALVAVASAIFLEGVRRAPAVAAAVVGANVLNLALNPLFIAGGPGVPAMGATGAALVTLAVRIALCVVLLAMVRRAARDWAQPLAARPTLIAGGGREQWRVGGTIAGTAAAMHGFGIALTVMAGWYGPLSLAAYASCWIVNLPFMLFATGYGDATTLRVARGDTRAVRRDGAMLAVILAGPALAIAAFAAPLASLYSADTALAALLAVLLSVSALVLWLDGMGLFLIAALRGRRDVAVPGAIQVGTMAATPILAVALASDIHGLVAVIAATSTLRLALLGVRAAPLLLPERPPQASIA